MDFSQLAALAGGYLEARVVQAAVSLGVFDALSGKEQDSRSVAAAIKTDPGATELLLDSLVALGLLEKKGALFSLNETSSTYLAQESPRYFGGMILFDATLWDCWRDLDLAVRTGGPVRPPDMYQGDPRETRHFIRAMDSLVKARGDADIMTGTFDFSSTRTLLDVGPGPGTYALHLCRKYPDLRVTLFDLPATLEISKEFVKDSGLGDRVELIAGDYRVDPIPARYQAIFLSNIIHGEGEDENDRLMAKLFPSLEPAGRIIIKDHILNDARTGPPVGALFSMLMLLTTVKGRCYSFSEVSQWLASAGFKRIEQRPLPPPLTSSLVIGEKD